MTTLQMRRADILVFDGQSLFLSPPGGPTAPTDILAALTTKRPGVVTNRLNTTYADRTTDVVQRVDYYAKKATGTRVLVDCGGSTDLGSLDADANIAAAETYWNARKTAGFNKVVVCTVPTAVIMSAPQQTTRAAYNIKVKASTVPDAVADIAAASELSDYTNTTYFLGDQTHPTAAGAIVIANLVLAALATLGIT